MAAIQNARDGLLQAVSPRVAAIPLPTNVTVDLSNTSQALNNLPSYTRVSGVTPLATQSSLAYGGGYLTGFGPVATQTALAYGSSYLTGLGTLAPLSSLAYGSGQLTGFGLLAPLSSVDLSSSYAVGSLAANRIQAGTLSAGVVYAGAISGTQITAGTLTVDRLQSGVGSFADTDLSFALASNLLGSTFAPAAIGGLSTNGTKFAGQFYNSGYAGVALVAGSASGSAGRFMGGYNATTAALSTNVWLGLADTAGSFFNQATGHMVGLCTASYAINIASGALRFGNTTIQPPTAVAGQYLGGDGVWRTLVDVNPGSYTATFSASNKPGVGNSTNSWAQINIRGVDWLIPVWPL